MVGFWGLNIGLMGMIAITIVSIGVLQAIESFQLGFSAARSWEFYQQPIINTLLWLRVIPDTVFIGLGAVPVVAAGVVGLLHLRKADTGALAERFTTEVIEERELISQR